MAECYLVYFDDADGKVIEHHEVGPCADLEEAIRGALVHITFPRGAIRFTITPCPPRPGER